MSCEFRLNPGQSAHGFRFEAAQPVVSGLSLTADCLVVRAPQSGSGVGRTVLDEPGMVSTQGGSGSLSFEGANPRARSHCNSHGGSASPEASPYLSARRNRHD